MKQDKLREECAENIAKEICKGTNRLPENRNKESDLVK